MSSEVGRPGEPIGGQLPLRRPPKHALSPVADLSAPVGRLVRKRSAGVQAFRRERGDVRFRGGSGALAPARRRSTGGARICDADGAGQRGNAQVPRGASFFSLAWREPDRPALREADRLGLEMSLKFLGGWNPEGPMPIDSGRRGPVTPGTVDFCE